MQRTMCVRLPGRVAPVRCHRPVTPPARPVLCTGVHVSAVFACKERCACGCRVDRIRVPSAWAARSDRPEWFAVDDFIIARNPDESSSLPYIVRLPLVGGAVVLKVRDTWPRTAKIYCHPAPGWPEIPDVVERVPVRSCARRGAAIDLVLDRGRENRSQFVFALGRGRDMIFWQSARTVRQARPNVSVPKMRASGSVLDVLVDTRERYPWQFANQQATTRRVTLSVGDYAVADADDIVAVVERKSLDDFVSTVGGGKLRYLMAALADVERAALVVEDRYSSVFKLERVRPSMVAEGLAEAQARVPSVPIVFAETRPLAQEWAYRFLGASLALHREHAGAAGRAEQLPAAGPISAAPVATAEIRRWAIANGHDVADRGRLRPEVRAAYDAAHPTTDD